MLMKKILKPIIHEARHRGHLSLLGFAVLSYRYRFGQKHQNPSRKLEGLYFTSPNRNTFGATKCSLDFF